MPVVVSVSEYVPVAVGVTAGFCMADVKPEGPLQVHSVAPLELALSVAVPPTHTGPLFVAPVDDGTGFTVTVVVYTVVGAHPDPVLLTVSEYVPVTVGVIAGFCNADVKPVGPFQLHAVASLELALNVADEPRHIGPLLLAPVDDGTGFTVIVVVYTVVGAQFIPTLLSVSE